MKQYKYMLQDGDRGYVKQRAVYHSVEKCLIEDGEDVGHQDTDAVFAGLLVQAENTGDCYVVGSRRDFVTSMGIYWYKNAIEEGSMTETAHHPDKQIMYSEDPVTDGDIKSLYKLYRNDVKGDAGDSFFIQDREYDAICEAMAKYTYHDARRLIEDYAAQCQENKSLPKFRANIVSLLKGRACNDANKTPRIASETLMTGTPTLQEKGGRTRKFKEYEFYMSRIGYMTICAKSKQQAMLLAEEICEMHSIDAYAIVPGGIHDNRKD